MVANDYLFFTFLNVMKYMNFISTLTLKYNHTISSPFSPANIVGRLVDLL